MLALALHVTKVCNPLVDVWSFGCVLAEVILGTPLFAAKSEREMMNMINFMDGMG